MEAHWFFQDGGEVNPLPSHTLIEPFLLLRMRNVQAGAR